MSTSNADLKLEFDRLVRLARAAKLTADWQLAPLGDDEHGRRLPWRIVEDGLILLSLGYQRGTALDRLRMASWAMEMLTTSKKPSPEEIDQALQQDALAEDI